jgi:hypothetical protein
MVDINEFYPAGLAKWKSKDFFKTISVSNENIIKNIKEGNEKEVKKEAQKTADNTMEGLAEKQAEAITLEKIYLNILDKKIDENYAEKLLKNLEYKINPSPLKWLQNKLKKIREWIVDAIKWLRNLANILTLRVKEITVEIGLTPKVTISFIPFEPENVK